MVASVKGMNPAEGDAGTKTTESLTLPADTEEYKAFFELWQKFEKMNPVGENKDTTEAVDADSGKWFDAGAVKGVREQIEEIKSVFANIKRLQADCDAVVKSLEKSSTNDKDNAKQLNEAKIKWLSDVSKNILGAMLKHILTMVGYAASKSQTLTNMSEK
jgi:septation ring formation regulator EzrA